MNLKRKAESNQRAINKLRTMCGGSRAESERDSGFSDASSEHTSTRGNTDSEDATLRVPQPGASRGPGSVISQLAVVGGSSYPNGSPMIFMNNVLLEQPGDTPKPLKPWGFRPEVVQQPQVVFLQPVVSHRTPASHQDPNSSRHRRTKKCLPLLKPFPKIAPHPGDNSSSSLFRGVAPAPTSSSSSYSSSSSSMSSLSTSSRSKRGPKLTSGHRDHSHRSKRHHHHHHHQKKRNQSGGHSSKSAPCVPESPGAVSLKSFPSAESGADHAPPTNTNHAPASEPGPSPTPAPAAPPVSVPHRPHAPLPTRDEEPAGPVSDPRLNPETKRMRFCNTYNILSKSGLLDITLRTKELLRQNRGVQSELDRLREHTELFIQALQSPDPGVFLRLQARFQQEVTAREEDTGE